MLGRLGRDPELFRFVHGSVANRVLARTRHALVELDPSRNPYLHWILTGTHGDDLPLALRPESFEDIRRNLDRLEWRCESLESFVAREGTGSIDRYNLSDIFEYVSPEDHRRTLGTIAASGRAGTRLAYWNLLASRRCPASLGPAFRSLGDVASRLHAADKGFFYSDFVLEEVA